MHESVAAQVLPKIAAALAPFDVEVRGCDRTRHFIPAADEASEEDHSVEFLGPIMSCRG